MKLVDREILKAPWLEWPADSDTRFKAHVEDMLELAVLGSEANNLTVLEAAEFACGIAEGFLNYQPDRTVDEAVDAAISEVTSRNLRTKYSI